MLLAGEAGGMDPGEAATNISHKPLLSDSHYVGY